MGCRAYTRHPYFINKLTHFIYMACNTVTLNGIDARCHTSAGGIKRVLIANVDDVKEIIIDWEEATQTGSDMVTAITMNADKKFAEWRFRKNTGSLSTSLASDPAIGNTTVTTELNLQFTKAEAVKRLEIQSAINAAAIVIVEDMYGQYILLGNENEVVVSAASMVTGTAATDLNGFTLTLQDISSKLPHFVEAEIIDGLLPEE